MIVDMLAMLLATRYFTMKAQDWDYEPAGLYEKLLGYVFKHFMPEKKKALDAFFYHTEYTHTQGGPYRSAYDKVKVVIEQYPNLLSNGIAEMIFEKMTAKPDYSDGHSAVFIKCLVYIGDDQYLKSRADYLFMQAQEFDEHWRQNEFIPCILEMYRKCNDTAGIYKCALWLYNRGESYPHDLHYQMSLFLEANAYDKIEEIAQSSYDWCGDGYDNFANYWLEVVRYFKADNEQSSQVKELTQ